MALQFLFSSHFPFANGYSPEIKTEKSHFILCVIHSMLCIFCPCCCLCLISPRIKSSAEMGCANLILPFKYSKPFMLRVIITEKYSFAPKWSSIALLLNEAKKTLLSHEVGTLFFIFTQRKNKRRVQKRRLNLSNNN